MQAYLDFFFSSAAAATTPAWLVALAKKDGAKVSEQVVSHTRILPLFQGTVVTPSGCLPPE